jgi:hypothetical protein
MPRFASMKMRENEIDVICHATFVDLQATGIGFTNILISA